MNNSLISTRGKKTVRWSTLPAEPEILSQDELLFGNAEYVDNTDKLALDIIMLLIDSKEVIFHAKHLFKKNIVEFRKFYKAVTKKELAGNKDNVFKLITKEHREYLWKVKGLKPNTILKYLSNVYFNIDYSSLILVSDRSTLKLNDFEHCYKELKDFGLDDTMLSTLPSMLKDLQAWLDNPNLYTIAEIQNELNEACLLSFNNYAPGHMLILNRVSKLIYGLNRSRYQVLTIASYIVFGVTLSTLKKDHDRGIIYEPRSAEHILSYSGYHGDISRLKMVLENYL